MRPVKPAAFHILLGLLDGEAHGYALLQSARAHAPGERPLSTASFYRHLHKLLDEGLVEAIARPAADDPRRGDYYRLTPAGRQVLVDEKARLTALMSALAGVQPATRRSR